jgi:glycosyltransferase involved in cell wall biosynthesis
VRVSFLIPAFNEAATIAEVLERVEALDLEKQVIVVDDGSTDETPAILDRWHDGRPERIVLRQPNAGKGAAIRAAIPYVDGEIAVVQRISSTTQPTCPR